MHYSNDLLRQYETAIETKVKDLTSLEELFEDIRLYLPELGDIDQVPRTLDADNDFLLTEIE